MDSIVLAADLGGTNLRIAAVRSDGGILYRTRTKTPKSGSGDIVAAIVALSRECLDSTSRDSKVVGFGLAVPAVINPSEGKIITSPNIADLDGLDLSAAISETVINVPVILENDATAAAIGENWLGASRGIESSICVTLGTGVGGGIILNGEPLRGIDGTAGEIGHICVEPQGVPCGCGSFGCVEQYSSASAISRLTYELKLEYPDSILLNETRTTPYHVFQAGLAGDELALEVFRRVGSYLGIALAGLINVLNPEVIVIGGGVAAGWELFIEHVRTEIQKRAFQQPAKRARIVRAELGDDAGILGAARLAFNNQQ